MLHLQAQAGPQVAFECLRQNLGKFWFQRQEKSIIDLVKAHA